jgi:hypothetical protein
MNKKDKAEELLKEAAKMQKRFESMIAEAKAMLTEDVPDICWTPKIGGDFYFLAADAVRGGVDDGEPVDIAIIASQQVFKTAEEAEKAHERRKAGMRVKRRIAELNEGWEPDFDDNARGEVLFIFRSYSINIFHVGRGFCTQDANANEYCKTEAIAQQVINELGEDWKLWKGITKV